MNMKKYIVTLCFFVFIKIAYGQSITIDPGATINVAIGADICASSHGNISGTLTGNGTQCEGALPVELVSFTASTIDLGVRLDWTTAIEVDNYGFEIERQNNTSEEWMKIGFREGHGNSNSPQDYSYFDSDDISGAILYRLKQIDIDGTFEYSESIEIDVPLPDKYELFQNRPNPFNPTTTIKYSIPEDTEVKLAIYDILGNEVELLIDQYQNAGTYSITFDASNLSSGIYYYKLQTSNYSEVKKMVLLK